MKTSIMSRKAISEPSHSLDRERGFLGLVKARKAGQVSQIDWNSLLLGKKVLSEQEVADVDVEAPRNSLESSPGTRTPRLSGVRHEEIPYSYEIPKPNPHYHGRSEEMYFSRTGESVKPKGAPAEVLAIKTLIAQDSSDAEHEKKRRSAPSVVARLMGLDTLPDKLSRGSPTKPPKASKSSHGSRKDTRPHSARAETCSRPPSPLHDVEIIKDFPLPRSRATTDSDICDDRMKFDALPFRAHPQERQLQEFKKEFMEKLANQRYGSNPGAAGVGDQLREVSAKKDFMEKLANQRYGSSPGAGDQLREVSAKKDFMEKLANQRYGSSPGAGDQLREVSAKKNFMEKLANQRYGSSPGAGDKLREVGAKRRVLREKLSETKQAMSGGGDEPRRLSSAQEKLMESKEFQDAIELLQTNQEFFKKFFPGSTIPSSGGNKDPPEPECLSRRSFHLGDSYAEPVRHDQTSRRSFHLGDFSRESRMTSLLEEPSKESSRRSFHFDDLTKESGRSFYDHPQESPRESYGRRSFHLDDHPSRDSRRSHRHVEDVTKEIRALEDYSDLRHGDHQTGSHGRATSEYRKRRETRRKSPGPNPVAEEVVILQKSSSRVSSKDRETISWSTPDHNNGSYGSPDSRKGCDSPSRIVVLKPGPGEITLLTATLDPSGSPHSYRVIRDSRGDLFEPHEVILLDPMERFSPSLMEEQRHSREEYRDPRVDPRAIARDIVREARTNSTRELSRDRETGRESPRPGHVRLNGSTGAKRASLPKYGHGLMESMEERISESDETMSSLALASLSRRHAGEEKSRCGSPTVPIPSPRSRSQEAPLTPDKFPSHKQGKLRKLPERTKTVYHVEQKEEQHRTGPTEVPMTMGQAHELNRAPMITRPRQFLPGLKSPASKGRADPFQESHIRAGGLNGADLNMYNTLPSTERVLKVESMYPSNHHQNGGNESQENSPRTILRMRSFPNAGAMVGAKIRSAEISSRIGGSVSHVQERMESSEHFYLKEKRAEARQAFLLSRKKIVGSDGTTLGRSASHQPRPVDNNAVQDIYVNNMSLGAVQQLNRSVVTRPAFEKAIPVEDVPRQGAGEHDLAGAFSQRTPKTPPGAKDTLETDGLRQPSSRKQLEVPVKQQGSKSSKAWSIATETIESGDGDGASETSVDKCGQPSPVSVLDSPFEAEISSPVEFKELSSDIQDLRLRLRLLKLDGSERSTVLSESVQAKEISIPQNQVVRHIENSLECTESFGSSFNSTNFSIYRDFEPQALQSQALLFQAENVDIQGLHCPEGRRGELLYVRNILVASGFIESGPMLVEKLYSPTCPLDPTLYEKLEESYLQADLQVISEHGNAKSKLCQQGSHDSSSRRLLFDVVNEVLLQLVGPYLTFEPWIRPPSAIIRPIPTNWQLFSATWSEICSYSYPEGVEEFEALDCLMSRDVSKRAPWMDCLASYEQIGLELERNIFESLIEETVLSYVLQ